MTQLPLTIDTQFVSTWQGHGEINKYLVKSVGKRIVLLEPGTGLLGVTWREGKIISRNNS